jgi:hypothetical protein
MIESFPKNWRFSVDITYVTKSRFLAPCEVSISEHRAEIDAGGLVQVNLEDGGYNGSVVVTIRKNDRKAFATDWEGADPTRFPARIKAAATALLHCGCEGRFKIAHRSGHLTIIAV